MRPKKIALYVSIGLLGLVLMGWLAGSRLKDAGMPAASLGLLNASPGAPVTLGDMGNAAATPQGSAKETLPVLSASMPEFTGITTWLNSPPLTAAQLKGKVVLVDFWTYSCI